MPKRLTLSLLLLLFVAATSPAQQPHAQFVVAGQVVDAAGQPFCRALVCAIPEVGPGRGFHCGRADANGQFRLRAAVGAGTYGVIAEAPESGRMSQFMPFYKHPTHAPPVVSVSETNPAPYVTVEIVPPSGVVETGYEFRFMGAQPGRWRVWAVDAEGREGFKSGWRRFVYLK